MFFVNYSNTQFGPYWSDAAAYFFATINFGFEGWTITQIDDVK